MTLTTPTAALSGHLWPRNALGTWRRKDRAELEAHIAAQHQGQQRFASPSCVECITLVRKAQQ